MKRYRQKSPEFLVFQIPSDARIHIEYPRVIADEKPDIYRSPEDGDLLVYNTETKAIFISSKKSLDRRSIYPVEEDQ